MCAQIYRVGDPYKLAGHRLPFTSWHYVRPGSLRWLDRHEKNVSVIGFEAPGEAEMRRSDHPWGVRLRVHEAQRVRGIFPREREWEQDGFVICALLKDGAVYRAWGTTSWQSSLPEKGDQLFLYYESDDGFSWRRPDLCVVERGGSARNNIVAVGRTRRELEHGGTVFIDPTSSEERYKMIAEARFTEEEAANYLRTRPAAVDGVVRVNRYKGLRGATSPDGINWSFFKEPILLNNADTQTIGYYDPELAKYVLYSRDWLALRQTDAVDGGGKPLSGIERNWHLSGRRAINRAESDDFRSFSLPQLVAEPPPTLPPSYCLYGNCRTTIPGAPAHHLMFPLVYTAGDGDGMYALLYSSHDGISWQSLSDEAVIRTGEPGEWDGGAHLFHTPNLVELPDGDFVLPYTGWNVPHKYPRQNARREVGYARWPKGRLVGVEAKDRGEFATVAVVPPGSSLRINAVTAPTGSILIEAADFRGVPLPGRSFKDAVPVVGNVHGDAVRWKEKADLGLARNEPAMLRVKMDRAVVYSFDFV